MAGRKPGFAHHEHTRNKIKAKQIINRLYQHVTADKPIMDASQVNAAKVLLGKVLPDLQSIEQALTGEITNHIISDEPVTPDNWKATHANGHGVGAPNGAAKGSD